MKRLALLLLIAVIFIPLASAHEITPINKPTEVVKGQPLGVYVRFTNTSNETVIITKIRLELVSQNGDLVNSSEQEFFFPVSPNATAVVYGYMIVDVQPGDYKYNVLIYYKEGDETKSQSVIEQQEIIVKSPSNPRVVLLLTVAIFGGTLAFLSRLGSRGLRR